MSRKENAEKIAEKIRNNEFFEKRNADVSVNRNVVIVNEYDRPNAELADQVEKIVQEVVGVENYSMQTTRKKYKVRVR